MIKWLLSFMLLASPCYAAVSFDATDDLITLGTNIVPQNEMTFFVRYKPNSNSTRGEIFSKERSDSGICNGNMLIHNTDGTVDFWCISGCTYPAADVVESTVTINLNKYNWIVSRLDQTANTIEINVNGTNRSEAYTNVCGTNNVNSFYVGASSSASNRTVDGDIDLFCYWDKKLTDAQVASLGNSNLQGHCRQFEPANLQTCLLLDDIADGISADGATFIDCSGNGLTGVGDDGANDTGLTGEAGVLSYQ